MHVLPKYHMRITLKFCLQANIHNEIEAKTMTIMFLEAAKLTDACEITDHRLCDGWQRAYMSCHAVIPLIR